MARRSSVPLGSMSPYDVTKRVKLKLDTGIADGSAEARAAMQAATDSYVDLVKPPVVTNSRYYDYQGVGKTYAELAEESQKRQARQKELRQYHVQMTQNDWERRLFGRTPAVAFYELLISEVRRTVAKIKSQTDFSQPNLNLFEYLRGVLVTMKERIFNESTTWAIFCAHLSDEGLDDIWDQLNLPTDPVVVQTTGRKQPKAIKPTPTRRSNPDAQ